MATSRRQEALELADELLRNIELSQLPPADVARKAYRLARLLDDGDAVDWLGYEAGGYPTGKSLDAKAWAAAVRSNRVYTNPNDEQRAQTAMLGELQATVDASLAQLASANDAPVSLTSANPYQTVTPPRGNQAERHALRNTVANRRALLDKVLGAIHAYVTARYQELRFGSAAETAFEVVRADVDANIARLVPEATEKLAAAFENAASDNPEHWANAAQTCRRLLKAAADALRPPGDPVDGRKMTDSHYINRLVDWIVNQARSETTADLISADLEYLGRRLDAADDAGHKGAHAAVDRLEASRFLTGTYLVLGDILRLRAASEAPRTTIDVADVAASATAVAEIDPTLQSLADDDVAPPEVV